MARSDRWLIFNNVAGLYIHIPYCRDACNYCDFHFSISAGNLGYMLNAIKKELNTEKNFLGEEELTTIYFGGGTPSLLSPDDIALLLDAVEENYTVDNQAEITLEANPDDLNQNYLMALKQLKINRLSIGIQSFNDEDLLAMNRRHDSLQARHCIELAQKAGFNNLSLDLIYGLPGMSKRKWENNLEVAMGFNPPHLATYHLSYEDGTVLDYKRRKRKVKPVNETRSLEHYMLLTEFMEKMGYEHYEISNFALPGRISKHNSGYWKGIKYLGVGPSAHSYDGHVRRWNMSKNSSYIRGIQEGSRIYDEEHLDPVSRLHEYLMTSLRTMWGTDLNYLKNEWGEDYYDHVMVRAEPFILSGRIMNVAGKLILTREGMFIADHIIAELFL